MFKLIEENVDKTAYISTDENPAYKFLGDELGYARHFMIKHGLKIYRVGSTCTNTIEGYFSQLKRMVKGTHIHVSLKYLPNYVGECNFRYNYRKRQPEMFEAIILNLPHVVYVD